jgi:hypothetical protein
MLVMSCHIRLSWASVFQRGWREAMPLLCRFFLCLRHEVASLAYVFATSLFPLACVFFFFSLLLLDLAWFRVRVGSTRLDGTGSRYVGRRCLDVVNGYHASSSYPPTLALPPSHPNIGCWSCFCLSASLAASPPLPAAPCPVNAARTTHHTPQTHHPVSSAAQPSLSRILHPANSLTRPLTCLTPHVHRRHVSRTSIPFSPPAGPPLPQCVALGRLVCATPGFEGSRVRVGAGGAKDRAHSSRARGGTSVARRACTAATAALYLGAAAAGCVGVGID